MKHLDRPVYSLSLDEAVAELEQLADNPPESSRDQAHWNARSEELRAWILMKQAPKDGAQVEVKQEMKIEPKPDSERLSGMIKLLERHQKEGNHRRVTCVRSAIRSLCAKAGLPLPEGLEDQRRLENRSGAVPKAPQGAGPVEPQRHPGPGAPFQGFRVRLLRLQQAVLDLHSSMVELDEEGRAENLKEVANLDAMVHLLATHMATGRVEVGG